VGVEFVGRGSIFGVNVFACGQHDTFDPGAPLPVPLRGPDLIDLVTTAVNSISGLTPNQRVAAELLNNSFFEMSPEARFLLRVSAVEALCPQADQTEDFRNLVDNVLASIPEDPSNQIKEALKRLAKRETVRSAYMSKIKRLLGNDNAKTFDELYRRRSNFLHEGAERGTLGEAANTALKICRELLLADIALRRARVSSRPAP
jgi:hypothetical protein